MVPYYLAPLWDQKLAARAEHRKTTSSNRQAADATKKVPRDLRAKFKKAKGARTLLQELEQEIRRFVQEWNQQTSVYEDHEGGEEEQEGNDDDDEQIVFVGRNGQMSLRPPPPTPPSPHPQQRPPTRHELKLLESSPDDQRAAFAYVFPLPLPPFSSLFFKIPFCQIYITPWH